MTLGTKHLYVKNIDYVKNVNIVEYDISQAGFSVIKKYKLLPDYTIAMLNYITDKYERNVRIGYLMRDHKGLGQLMNDKIKDERITFITNNDINDSDIFAIRKDAIFLINKTPKVLDNCEFIKFKPKSRYSSFMRLERHEFYYNNKTDIMDIKNMKKDNIPLHFAWLDFIKTIMRISEKGTSYNVFMKLKTFRNEYVNLFSDIHYYREFNDDSKYKLKTEDGSAVYLDNVGEGFKQFLDIRKNINVLSNISKIML